MKILIAGGTGFIGKHLISALLKEENELFVLGRNKEKINRLFNNKVNSLNWSELNNYGPDNFDAVINLTGHNIGASRWTKTAKQLIKNSRLQTTQQLAVWCSQTENPPHLYNASAIGIYGLQPTSAEVPKSLTENTPIQWNQPTDFLSEIGQQWEQAAKSALDANVPVTFMRFAVVLKHNEGALKKIMPAFKFGLGGKLGSGQQAFCWVYIEDLINAILFLLKHPEITGAVNICAPECVTQKQFAQTLGKVLHRPALLTTPAWLLKILFGQMAEELLLSGQCVYPEKLLASGFEFTYPTLEAALRHDFA